MEKVQNADHVEQDVTDRVLEIMREFDAPRELVYRMWVERDHVMHWMGPKDFEVIHAEADLSVGGEWRSGMRSPKGIEYWMSGVYRELVRPEKLVFTHRWDTQDGTPGHETLVTVRFEEAGPGRSRMIFRQEVFATLSARNDHRGGWTETFDRLEVRVAKLARNESINVA